jgi:hypothetical protein
LAELVHCCVSPLSSRSSNVPKFGKCGEGRLERAKRTGGVVSPAFELRAMEFAPQRMHSREKCEAQLGTLAVSVRPIVS